MSWTSQEGFQISFLWVVIGYKMHGNPWLTWKFVAPLSDVKIFRKQNLSKLFSLTRVHCSNLLNELIINDKIQTFLYSLIWRSLSAASMSIMFLRTAILSFMTFFKLEHNLPNNLIPLTLISNLYFSLLSIIQFL